MNTKLRKLLTAIGALNEPGTRSVELDGSVGDALALVVPIAKVNEEKRLVFGVVYEPDTPDAHDDAMSAEEIEKSAHGFLARYGTLTGDLGTDHERTARRSEIAIVESFIAPADFQLGDQVVKAGSWVMAAKVLSDVLWKAVKSGQFVGWSFEGFGTREPATA